MLCPQCSKAEIKQKEGESCYECGYKFIAVKDEGTYEMVFCTHCGTHYSSGQCPIHEKDVIKV